MGYLSTTTTPIPLFLVVPYLVACILWHRMLNGSGVGAFQRMARSNPLLLLCDGCLFSVFTILVVLEGPPHIYRQRTPHFSRLLFYSSLYPISLLPSQRTIVPVNDVDT